MKQMLRIFLLIAGTQPVFADPSVQEQASRALNNAQVFDNYSVPKARNTLSIPVKKQLPESDLDAAQLQDQGAQAATADTETGTAFKVMGDNTVAWSVLSADPTLLGSAHAAVDDPEAYLSENPFSTTGPDCTVTEFSEAPVFERTCSRNRNVVSAACTSTARITVTRTEVYECSLSGSGPGCDALQGAGYCVETDRRCDLSDAAGTCLEEVASFTCSSDAPMSFEATLIGSTLFSAPIIDWQTSCDQNFVAGSCHEGATTCISGASVEDVNGLLVPMDCTVEETAYTCGASSYSSPECSAFEEDAGCQLIGSDCFMRGPDGVCGSYEDTYRCGSSDAVGFDPTCEAVNVCVGDYCQSIEQETTADLPKSLAAISLLNEMAKEWHYGEREVCVYPEPEDCEDFQCFVCEWVTVPNNKLQYFNNSEKGCRIGILGTYNCCSDSGWALGVFTECKDSELVLLAAVDAGRTVYLETDCSKKALFVCLERKKIYCVFNSGIGREVNYQGQMQLYGRFNCRALRHEEMERIDWSKIDLSPVFDEMLANVDNVGAGDLLDVIEGNVTLAAPEVVSGYE